LILKFEQKVLNKAGFIDKFSGVGHIN